MQISALINRPEHYTGDRVQVESDPTRIGYWAKQNGKLATITKVKGSATLQLNEEGKTKKVDNHWMYTLSFDDGGRGIYDRINGTTLRHVKPDSDPPASVPAKEAADD